MFPKDSFDQKREREFYNFISLKLWTKEEEEEEDLKRVRAILLLNLLSCL